MHGLPWLNQPNLAPASTQMITASFKVLSNSVSAFEPPLPDIPPVPETPIEPIKPNKITKAKPVQKQKKIPKPEPILQLEEIAQVEDFAITEQTIDIEAEITTASTEATPETTGNMATLNNQSAVAPTEANATQRQQARENLYANFGRDLQRLCERNKQYPAIAIRRSLEGAGSVQVTFSKNGTVLGINIEQSTGQNSLDKQAVKMVQKSLSSLPLPRQLRGQVLTLTVPVTFSLDG